MAGGAGTHTPSAAAKSAGALSGRRSAVAQERRDVDLVVGDLERPAQDARTAVAPPGAAARLPARAGRTGVAAGGGVARLLARGARAGAAVVEAGGDHRHAVLVAHVLVDDRAED